MRRVLEGAPRVAGPAARADSAGDLPLRAFQRAAGNRALAGMLAPPGATAGRPERHVNPSALREFLRAGPARTPPHDTAAAGRSDPVSARLRDAGRTARVYEGPASRRAAARLGGYAYTFAGDVFLGEGVGRPGGPSRDEVLRHELSHVAQSRRDTATGSSRAATARPVELEGEAEHGGSRLAADPTQPLGFWWVIPVIAGAYVLLRPSTANAPSPEDVAANRLVPSTSPLQVGAEAMALFALPVGVAGVLGRMGYGVVASFAVSGAASSVSYRGVQDIGAGEFSGVEAYVVDATTGAVIGVVVGGTFRAVGGPGALGLRSQPDQLVHFTDEAGQAGIRSSGVLRGSQGIYAVPQASAAQGTAGRTAQTLLAPAQTTHAVTLPQTAGGAFVRPVPLGPMSTYQYFMGVHRAAAGSINMSTGAFTAGSSRFLPNVTGQFFPYGVDAVLWIAAASMSPAVEGAETRGLPGLGVPTLPYVMRDTILSAGPQPVTTLTDGPFIVLPPPVVGLDAPQDVAAATQQRYDPIAQVCLRPGEDSSRAGGAATAPAVILVAPLGGGAWPPGR